MIPLHILPQVSPTAAKLYLVLLANLDPQNPYPLCRANITTLARLSALSVRTCWTGLRELTGLRLLQRLPRKYHQPNAYLLLPGRDPSTMQPTAQFTAPTAQPAAQFPTSTMRPAAQYHPPAASSAARYTPPPMAPNPAAAPKTQSVQPAAQLLTKNSPLATRPIPAAPAAARKPLDPALIRLLLPQLSPADCQALADLARQSRPKPEPAP
jgi:hypothetical protein